MLKNKLYPYIEEYVNKYLYGFTKEQFDIGVTNGSITLDNLNLRPDTINAILNTKNIPLWLKFGHIDNITISCSLMNFIGEKPIDVNIRNLDIITCPSYKYIVDTNSGNSNTIDINAMIYDNDYKKEKNLNGAIKAVIDKAKSFVEMQNFNVNIVINNVNVKFEDDNMIYSSNGNIGLGLKSEMIEISSANEGALKKNKIKMSNAYIYYDLNPTILIPSDWLVSNIKNIERYYQLIHDLNYNDFNVKSNNRQHLVNKFSMEMKFGTKKEKGNQINELFTAEQTTTIVYCNLALTDIVINVIPGVIDVFKSIKEFIEYFDIVRASRRYKKKKIRKAKELIEYYVLFRRMIRHKKENLLRKEHCRFMAMFEEDVDVREKELSEDIVIMNKGKERTAYLITDNTNINDDDDTSSIITNNNKTIVPNVNFISEILLTKITMNLFDSNLSRYVSFTISTIKSKSSISKDLTNFTLSIKQFDIKTNDTFQSPDKSIPKFQFRYNDPSPSTAPIIHQTNRTTPQLVVAGLKASSLLDDSAQVQKTKAKLYSEAARYARKMRILSTTLHINTTQNLPFKSNNYNPKNEMEKMFYNKPKTNFISALCAYDSVRTEDNRTDTYLKAQRDNSVSKAIKDYNTQKSKINMMISSTSSSQFVSKMSLVRNHSFTNKATSLAKSNCDLFPLTFITISSITISFENQPEVKNSNKIDINCNSVRINFFKEYLSSLTSLLISYGISPYESINKNDIIISFFKREIQIKKYLFTMIKKHYDFIVGRYDITKLKHKQYVNYLKSYLTQFPFAFNDSNMNQFEMDYLFSYYFSNSIELNTSITSFNFLLYKNIANMVNHILSHIKIDDIDTKIYIALSYLYMKIFKTELEVNEYDSIYEVIKDVIDEVKGKFRRVVNAIKPCVSIVKSEIESNANRENKDNNMSIMNDEMMRKSYNSVYSAPKYTIELKKNKTYDNERNKDNNIIYNSKTFL